MIDKIIDWTLRSSAPAFDDKESLTALELCTKATNKVNECIEAYNNLLTTVNDQFDVQDGKINEAIKYMKDNLIDSLHQLMIEMEQSGELGTELLSAISSVETDLQNYITSNNQALNNYITSNDNALATTNQNITNINEDIVTINNAITTINNAINDINNNITSVVNSTVKVYDNIQSVINDTTLSNNRIIETRGYYTAYDGGEGKYVIVEDDLSSSVDNGSIIELVANSKYLKLLETFEVNIKQFGAKCDGVTDDKLPIDKAISYLHNGGKLILPKGNILTSGNHVIDATNEFEISGEGNYGTYIIFQGTGYCFWFINTGSYLLIPQGISNLKINSTNTDTNSIIKLSDRWGSFVKNVTIYPSATQTAIELYNNNGWTEGSIIENVMIRGGFTGVAFRRNALSETATDSFFNTNIRNLYMDLLVGNSRIISLEPTSSSYPIKAYDCKISITGWSEGTGGGKYYVRVYGYASLTGELNIITDGTGGVTDGTDFNLVKVWDDAMLDVNGYTRFQHTAYNASYSLRQAVSQVTNWKYLTERRPLARYKGASVKFGGTAAATSVCYSSQYLPPFSTYKVKVIDGDFSVKEYLVTTTNLNINPYIVKLNGATDGNVTLRPVGGGTQGAYSEGNGLRFELYNSSASSVVFNGEIEMQ